MPTIFCGCCLFLAGCQPGARMLFPWETTDIQIKNTSVSSQILTCVAATQAMTSKQLHEQFIRANDSFQLSGSNTDRLQLICLCLAWSDSPVTLNLGMSVLSEYVTSNDSTGEDLQGLYWLLKSFEQRRREKEIELKNVTIKTNAREIELENAAIKIKALENQLQKLKNIEKIINERTQ